MSSSKYTPRGVVTSSNSPLDEAKSKTLKTQGEVEDEPSSFKVISFGRLTPPLSPLRRISDSTSTEKKLVDETIQSVSTLKTRLGLDSGRCGSSRVNPRDPPCRVVILEGKRDKIESQIQSMITLTKSSPELLVELEKLVMLVHCHHHDCGTPKTSRIDAWKEVFPSGATTTVVSVEDQIRKALGQLSAQCIAITSQGKSCPWSIGGQKVQNCTKTIDEIIKPEVYLHDANLDRLLNVLELNMYCNVHMGKKPLKHVASWKLSIVSIRKIDESMVIQSIESDEPDELENKTQTSKTQQPRVALNKSSDLVLHNRRLPTPRNSRSLSPEFDRHPASFWPKAFDITPFNIIARSDKLTEFKSSYKLLQELLTTNLDKEDQQEGHVYLYEVGGNKGFVKIGYTGRSVTTRHDEWSFACNRESKTLYPATSQSTIVIPNARRVEALCHAELDHRRIRIYCAACLKQHIEWFEVSAAEAIAVIQKWSTWMKTHPYQTIELRSGTKKTIKEEEKRRTSDMNRFMKDISAAVI